MKHRILVCAVVYLLTSLGIAPIITAGAAPPRDARAAHEAASKRRADRTTHFPKDSPKPQTDELQKLQKDPKSLAGRVEELLEEKDRREGRPSLNISPAPQEGDQGYSRFKRILRFPEDDRKGHFPHHGPHHSASPTPTSTPVPTATPTPATTDKLRFGPVQTESPATVEGLEIPDRKSESFRKLSQQDSSRPASSPNTNATPVATGTPRPLSPN